MRLMAQEIYFLSSQRRICFTGIFVVDIVIMETFSREKNSL